MKMLVIIFALVIGHSICVAQPIQLTQVKDSADFEVVSGKYKMYFRPVDIVTAIAIIDNKINSDHSRLKNWLKENKLRSVNVSSTARSDAEFIKFLRENLGCYLITRGKVVIVRDASLLGTIIADESPPMVELDGSSSIGWGFVEKGAREAIFYGQLSTKLEKGPLLSPF